MSAIAMLDLTIYEFLILRVLTDNGEQYSRQIMDAARTLAKMKTVPFSRGVLYTALTRLEGREFLTSWMGESVRGPRRRYYAVTGTGRIAFLQTRTTLQNILAPKLQ